jgi:hypothetical protein
LPALSGLQKRRGSQSARDRAGNVFMRLGLDS